MDRTECITHTCTGKSLPFSLNAHIFCLVRKWLTSLHASSPQVPPLRHSLPALSAFPKSSAVSSVNLWFYVFVNNKVSGSLTVNPKPHRLSAHYLLRFPKLITACSVYELWPLRHPHLASSPTGCASVTMPRGNPSKTVCMEVLKDKKYNTTIAGNKSKQKHKNPRQFFISAKPAKAVTKESILRGKRAFCLLLRSNVQK